MWRPCSFSVCGTGWVWQLKGLLFIVDSDCCERSIETKFVEVTLGNAVFVRGIESFACARLGVICLACWGSGVPSRVNYVYICVLFGTGCPLWIAQSLYGCDWSKLGGGCLETFLGEA